MSPLDIFWHLLNGMAPAFGLALLAPALVKFVWRDQVRSVSYGRLVVWAFTAALLTTVLNSALLDRDGRMLGYANLVLVTASAIWWAALGPGSPKRR
jgi:hypothetical protein